MGFDLTLSERKLILSSASKDGKLTPKKWEELVTPRGRRAAERMTISEYLTKSHDAHVGQAMLLNTARLGIGE